MTTPSSFLAAERTPGPARWCAAVFVVFLAVVPAVQIVWERGEGRVRTLDELWIAARSGHPALFEDALTRSSWIREQVVPWYQAALTAILGHGNEKALEGDESWLYYADDVEFVTGPGVLHPALAGTRALEVIVDFRDQLAAHDIQLLLLPVPMKGMIDSAALARPNQAQMPTNAQLTDFFARLTEHGVPWIDLVSWMNERSEEGPQFLPRDTHWTPQTMQAVAELVAERIESMIGPPEMELEPEVQDTLHSAEGDLVAMLRLPRVSSRFPPMELALQQVLRLDGSHWRSQLRAEVTLLGDSFTGAFSDGRLGLGESAGLAEHLSLALRRPVDCIAIPNGGATTVREAFARREQGLENKRVVVWQFALRTLADAPQSWRRLQLGAPAIEAPAQARLEVRAKITEVSRVPADFAYERCLAIFEYTILDVRSGEAAKGDRLWVAHLAVDRRKPTPVEHYEIGDVHQLELEPIALHFDLEQTSWVDDTLVEGPIWWGPVH